MGTLGGWVYTTILTLLLVFSRQRDGDVAPTGAFLDLDGIIAAFALFNFTSSALSAVRLSGD